MTFADHVLGVVAMAVTLVFLLLPVVVMVAALVCPWVYAGRALLLYLEKRKTQRSAAR